MRKPHSKSGRRTREPRPQQLEQLPDVSDEVRRAYPDELQSLERRLKDRQQKFTVGMREHIVDWIQDLPVCCMVSNKLSNHVGEKRALDFAMEISEAYRDWLIGHILGPDEFVSLYCTFGGPSCVKRPGPSGVGLGRGFFAAAASWL